MADLAAAEAKAEYVLNSFGRDMPVDLVDLSKSLGLTLKLMDEQGVSGRLDRTSKTIFLNEKDSHYRTLFTIAHELGHYFLHEGDDVLHRHSFYSNDDKEIEANHFAACLLMPEREFRRAYDALDQDISAMSRYFGVSRPAVAFRIDYLGGVVNEYV